VRAIAKALEDGAMVRREIGERIGFKGQALTHLLLAAALDGLIVRGPVRGREQAFVRLEKLPTIDREKALKELAIRYSAGHAEATDADLAYWSGLPLRDLRGRLPARARARTAAPRNLPPKLLPPFDPLILGWKDRSFAIPPELAKRVMPGGGMFRAVVLVDGIVTGTWSRSGGRVQLDAPADGLDAEIADVERFLEDGGPAPSSRSAGLV
jgi:hypothetical protein